MSVLGMTFISLLASYLIKPRLYLNTIVVKFDYDKIL